MNAFAESTGEQAALALQEGVGWFVSNGAKIAAGEGSAIRGIAEPAP